MNGLENIIDAIAERVAGIVVERLRGGQPGMIAQSESPLGRRRHCAAVRKRMARGEAGAAVVGRRHLLSQEALGEELERSTKAPVEPTGPADLRRELESELRTLQQAKRSRGGTLTRLKPINGAAVRCGE